MAWFNSLKTKQLNLKQFSSSFHYSSSHSLGIHEVPTDACFPAVLPGTVGQGQDILRLCLRWRSWTSCATLVNSPLCSQAVWASTLTLPLTNCRTISWASNTWGSGCHSRWLGAQMLMRLRLCL